MHLKDIHHADNKTIFVTDVPIPHMLDEKQEKGEGLWNAVKAGVLGSIILVFTLSAGFPAQKVLSAPDREDRTGWPEQRKFVDRNEDGTIPTRSEAERGSKEAHKVYIGPKELENV